MKVEDFGPFTLSAGAHKGGPQEGMCVMEMVSFIAGEEWSDCPPCSSHVVAKFCQVLNDRMGQDFRDKLQAYVPRLIGTVSPEHERERAEYLAWSAITVFAPIALEAQGLNKEANELRHFDKSKGLRAAEIHCREIRNAATYVSAVTDAVYAAAYTNAAVYVAAYAAITADSEAAAEYAATAAVDADADAAFKILDGLLEIGPSGEQLVPAQVARIEPLREAVSV